jgi:hypothetical protein
VVPGALDAFAVSGDRLEHYGDIPLLVGGQIFGNCQPPGETDCAGGQHLFPPAVARFLERVVHVDKFVSCPGPRGMACANGLSPTQQIRRNLFILRHTFHDGTIPSIHLP